MVTRTSQAVTLHQAGQQSIQANAPAPAAADPNAGRIFGSELGQQSSNRLLQKMAAASTKLADQFANTQLEDLYLSGAAQAGSIASEAEIEGNPLTRDWAVAGYRDTMGKIAMAEQQSKLAVEMNTLREATPEVFQTRLTEMRKELLPTLEGMSREARTAAFGKMLLNDQHAIAAHSTAHQAFIIDKQKIAINMGIDTHLADLNMARKSGDPKVLDAAGSAFAANLYADVVENKALPKDIKENLIGEAMQILLANNHLGAFNTLYSTQMPDAEQGTDQMSTLFSRLPEAKRVAISNTFRETMHRNAGKNSTDIIDNLALVKAQIENGTFKGTEDDVKAMADTAQRADIPGFERGSFLQHFYVMRDKVASTSGLATAGVTGDIRTQLASGKSKKEVLDAIAADTLNSPEAKANPTTATAMLATRYATAGTNGTPGAFTAYGAVVAPSFQQITRPDGTLDEQHRVMVATTFKQLEDAERAGQPNAYNDMLQGMDERTQLRVARIRGFMRDTGRDATGAIQATLALEAKYAGMSPQELAAASAVKATDIAKEIQTIEGKGFVMNFIDTYWPTQKAQASHKISPSEPLWGWFQNTATVATSVSNARAAVAQELHDMAVLDPGMQVKDYMGVAMARVANRTIPTESGPLFLPKGSSIQQVFGTAASTDAETIGKAIDGSLPHTKDGTKYNYAFARGRVVVQEVDKDNNTVSNRELDPAIVRQKITEQTDAKHRVIDEHTGTGKTVSNATGSVTYNGVNTAAVDNPLMLKFRDNLVSSESVRTTPYKDLSGRSVNGKPIMTVGVGVSSHNKFYPPIEPDGTVSKANIDKSFKYASDAAAVAGAQISRQTQKTGESWFLLFSELAYQAGPGFIQKKEYQEVVTAPTPEARALAFKNTEAYRVSGATRRSHYDKLIRSTT